MLQPCRPRRVSRSVVLLATLVVLAACHRPGHPHDPTPSDTVSARLTENDVTYVGSFRLPAGQQGADYTSTFSYGGQSAAFRPDGDPAGVADGYGGSLYVTGHQQGQLVAEVSIPQPVNHRWGQANLPEAELLHPFVDVTGGRVGPNVGEGRLGGLEWVDPAPGDPGQGAQLHWTMRHWYNVSGDDLAGHGWVPADLDEAAEVRGPWRLNGFHNQMTAGYVFTAPQAFADEHLDGKRLVAGLNGIEGNATTSWGPSFIAFDSSLETEVPTGGAIDAKGIGYFRYPDHQANGFQEADRWGGAAWITDGAKEAVMVVGRKALGNRYGQPEPGDCSQYQGEHGDPYESRVLFYDPVDVARAAAGEISPWELEPYLEWDPVFTLLATCDGYLSSVSFDAERGLLYIVQPEADAMSEAAPVVHVYRI